MTQAKRPFGVWFISIPLILLSLYGGGFFSYVVLMNLTHWDHTLPIGFSPQLIINQIGISSINIIASINLMRLKKSAFYLFVLSFIFSILLTASTLLTSAGRAGFLGQGFMGAIINWPIFFGICFYCYDLKKESILT